MMPSNFCCGECAGHVSVAIGSHRRRIAERFRFDCAMKRACLFVFGGLLVLGPPCGCHSTTAKPQFEELPVAKVQSRLPQPGDLVIKGAKPGTTRDNLVSAIDRGFGTNRIITNVHPQSWLEDDQKLADNILSGVQVTITGFSAEAADRLLQALRAAGASVTLVK